MAKIKSMIGCEISSNEIRAVEIAKNNGVYQILAMGYIPVQKGVVEEGFIRDGDNFQKAFTELMKSGNFSSNNVAITVNNENVMMRYASFPKVENDKLRSMILLQAQEFIPIPISEMEVDYVIAGESVGEDNMAQYNIMLVAARRQMLDGYINQFSAMKYSVVDIDSSLLSMCRGLQGVCGDAKYCLINVTDDILNFIVVKGDNISMVRSITIPDRSRYAVAELFGMNEPGEDGEEANSEEAIEAAKNFIMSETVSTISYHSMQSDEQIEKIYFTSTCKYNKEIVDQIQDNMPIPVEIPNFYPALQADSAAPLSNYASCIGVAISGLEG